MEGGDRTVNSVLAEIKLYQRTRTEPIIVLKTETDDYQGIMSSTIVHLTVYSRVLVM